MTGLLSAYIACYEPKLPNLELKTQPKQLSSYLP